MGNKAANPAQESSLVNNTRNAHELKPAEVSKQEEQPSGGRNGHDKQPTGADGDVPARTPGKYAVYNVRRAPGM